METGILRQARGVAEKNDDDKLSKEEVAVSLSKVPTLMTEREREFSNYLDEWVLSRYGKWNELYRDINQYRRTGIYLLKHGYELLDFLISVVSNLEEHFAHEESIQHIFVFCIHLLIPPFRGILKTPIDSVLHLSATMTSADFCTFSTTLGSGYPFQGVPYRPP